jgi:hypothetical protein
MKKSYYFYTTFGLLILLGLIISGYIFGWTVPSTTPPGGNLAPPINTGSTNQAKTGYLAVGTSTTPTYPLEVGNQLRVWGQLISKVASGTAPFVVDSPTKVTNLNADSLDGYDSSDLLGGSVEIPVQASTYFYNGGNPYYCKKGTIRVDGYVSYTNINDNKPCDSGKVCWNGECMMGSYYCDSDGDGYVSSYKVASCSNPKPSAGTDCDDSCSTCFPGSTYVTFSPDGLDQDCDGTIDELDQIVYFLFDTITYRGNLGGRAGADAKCNTDSDKPASCASSAWAFISVNDDDEIRDMPTTKGVNTSYPWYFRDGSATPSLAANNWADLLDGSVINTPQSGGLDGNYWTGSYYTGAMATYGNCNGFVDSGTTVQGVYGNISRSDSGWLNAATNPYYYCNYVYDVLCACMQGFQ